MSMKKEFNETIRKELKKEMGVGSILAVPTLEKIVINMGIGKTKDNKQFLEEAVNDITKIASQKPILTKSRIAISNFKLRKGVTVGIAVTLRGERMWDFYEKLVKIAFPRVKDFRGISKKSFDGKGNYNIGFKDMLIFPEIDANKINFTKPVQITIKTTAKNNEEGYMLLKRLEMPFAKVIN